MRTFITISIVCMLTIAAKAQPPFVSKVWVADKGDGTYQNPVLHGDWSDPDAIRVGDDFYMISSSFNHVPGLPILHSKDLVNWTIIGHALNRLSPADRYDQVQHGGGVWAPSIRYHQNRFFIYYPDPDLGIFMIQAQAIIGPWSDPVLVEAGKGLIDPCPLWDDATGKAYLAHAFAGSRAGIKSIIVIKQMNAEGTRTLDAGVMVYDGHEKDPTIEGPKLYKRNGWYYIMAPAGGVSTGWQLVLRSKNIYGPYERKVVMDQGNTSVNGPHQGAWVDTKNGEHWFLHFQDKEAYGRVVHLQPMRWVNDWPVIGADADGDGKGQPVMVHAKPRVDGKVLMTTPQDADQFDRPSLGQQWQWQANPKPTWAFPTTSGSLRMFSVQKADSVRNLWDLPNVLGQTFPAEAFVATVRLRPQLKFDQERFGLVILGTDHASINLQQQKDGLHVAYTECLNADKGAAERTVVDEAVNGRELYLRVTVSKGAMCSFSFSTDGTNFRNMGTPFKAKPGKWIGSVIGMYCTRSNSTNDAGFVDIDSITFEPIAS